MNREEEKWLRLYNQYCGKFLQKEGCRRGIPVYRIARGICSATTLERIERGEISWRKMDGDILLQRLGVPTEYFEVMTEEEELDRWRNREDICMAILEQPKKARHMLNAYQRQYRILPPIEKQFVKKMQTILLMKEFKNRPGNDQKERMLESAWACVLCTLPKDWKQKELSEFLLAPAELESILLLAFCSFLAGERNEAHLLHQKVWEYLEQSNFEPKVRVLICPQASLLGMEMEMQAGNFQKAFAYGREALELLRKEYSQRYVILVLEKLRDVLQYCPEQDAYGQKIENYRKTFETLYDLFSYPKKRLWQSVTVSNTHEIGLTLRMLRKAMGLSAAKATAIAPDSVTPRQLEKIEAGIHRPSVRNYKKLVEVYQKTGLESQLLIETQSLAVLRQRQEIVDCFIREDWEKAWMSFQSFRNRLDADSLVNKQELLYLEATIQYKKAE